LLAAWLTALAGVRAVLGRYTLSMYENLPDVEWIHGFTLALLPLIASAYLAAAFEHAQASLEGGIAGYGSALIWCALLEEEALPVLLAMLAGGSGLVGTLVLVGRRGVGANSVSERVGADLRTRDLWITLPAHLAFVVLPITVGVVAVFGLPIRVLATLTLWPAAVFMLALGALALPWAWKDTDRRNVRGLRRGLAHVLVATGAGVWIWRWIRPRGELIECPACSSQHLDRTLACPRCGHEPLLVLKRARLARVVPHTPRALLLTGFAGVLGITLALGGLRFLHLLQLRTTLPGADLQLVTAEGVSGAESWHFGARGGPPIGLFSSNGERFDWPSRFEPGAMQAPLEAGAVADLLAQDSVFEPWGSPTVPEWLRDRLAPEDEISVEYRGQPCRIERLTGNIHFENFRVEVTLDIDARSAEVDALLEELVTAWRAGGPSEELLRAADEHSDALFFTLWKQRREIERSELDPLLLILLKRRYSFDPPDPERVLADAHRRIAEQEWMTDSGHRWGFLYRYVYPQVMALGAMDASIEPRLRERIHGDDPVALLAAGMGRFEGLFEDCRMAFDRNEEPDETDPALAAAWALLMIDPERGARHLMSYPVWFRHSEQWGIPELLATTQVSGVQKWILANAGRETEAAMQRWREGPKLEEYPWDESDAGRP
jgi:hypothetical protein